jgi:hypothetical protein
MGAAWSPPRVVGVRDTESHTYAVIANTIRFGGMRRARAADLR